MTRLDTPVIASPDPDKNIEVGRDGGGVVISRRDESLYGEWAQENTAPLFLSLKLLATLLAPFTVPVSKPDEPMKSSVVTPGWRSADRLGTRPRSRGR
jgi:hypothetical protein